jgi:hypothetical protein
MTAGNRRRRIRIRDGKFFSKQIGLVDDSAIWLAFGKDRLNGDKSAFYRESPGGDSHRAA